jgi:hypothetical protein
MRLEDLPRLLEVLVAPLRAVPAFRKDVHQRHLGTNRSCECERVVGGFQRRGPEIDRDQDAVERCSGRNGRLLVDDENRTRRGNRETRDQGTQASVLPVHTDRDHVRFDELRMPHDFSERLSFGH